MARYTETQTISFSDLRDSRAIIVDGDVTISSFDGANWIEASTVTSGSYELFSKGLRLRFTLNSGSSYWIDEGENK